MLGAVPLPDQHRTGFDGALRLDRDRSPLPSVACDAAQKAPRSGFQTAESLLLKAIGQRLDKQRAAKPVGWIRAVQGLSSSIEFLGTERDKDL